MKTSIIRIGHAKGIRLPKSILEQCQLKDTVEIEVKDNALIVRPLQAPRDSWPQAFVKMAEHKDDRLLDQDTKSATGWDRREWRW